MLSDPLHSQYAAVSNKTTLVLPFSERLVLAERVIYVTVAALLTWFVFEVSCV